MKLSDYFNESEIVNDGDFALTHYCNSKIKKSVTFAESKYFFDKAVNNENISSIITNDNYYHNNEPNKGLLVTKNPKKYFFHLHNKLFGNGDNNLVKDSKISNSSKISSSAIIKSNVIIEDGVQIDDYVIVESNSIIEEGSHIHAHSVIGASGMHNSYINDDYINVCDAGGVRIGKNCKILSSSIIQKSYFHEYTEIDDQTVISCNVNIGHGTKIGKNTMISGSSQISGYVSIGENVWVGPSAVIADNITIGNDAKVLIGSTVVQNVGEKNTVSGNFAFDHKKHLAFYTKNKK